MTTPNTAAPKAAEIKQGEALTLHGASIKIITTDKDETRAEYTNKAQRLFRTADLHHYREHGVFPAGAAFYRRTDKGVESIFIEHVTPDTYIVEAVDADNHSITKTMTYLALIEWHMAGEKVDPNLGLPEKTQLYVPKVTVPPAAPPDEDDEQPFETDLQKEVEALRAKLAKANKDAQDAEINGQTRINSLLREVGELKAELLKQHDLHSTELLAKNDRIESLERKAAILYPAPVRKEVFTLSQRMRNPEERTASDAELAAKLSDGWTPLDFSYDFSETTWRYVTLVRDLPAEPAPKLKVAETDTAIYTGVIPSTGRPPVQRPPASTVIMSGSRALTRNTRKPGDTRPISSNMQRQSDAEVFADIAKRNAAARAAILNQPSRPFGQ